MALELNTGISYYIKEQKNTLFVFHDKIDRIELTYFYCYIKSDMPFTYHALY